MKKNKYIILIVVCIIIVIPVLIFNYNSINNYLFLLSDGSLRKLLIINQNTASQSYDTLYNNKTTIIKIKKTDYRTLVLVKESHEVQFILLVNHDSVIVYKHKPTLKIESFENNEYLIPINFFTKVALIQMKDNIINWDTLEGKINHSSFLLKIYGINNSRGNSEFIGIHSKENAEIFYFKENAGALRLERFWPIKTLNNIKLFKL